MRALSAVITCAAGLGCQPSAPDTPEPVERLSHNDVRCLVSAVIEDGENNDHQVLGRQGRSGYIYSFADDDTAVEPVTGKKGGRFTMSEGGANGSAFAARIHGKTSTGKLAFAGVGFNFVDPKGPYDASKHQGIAFYARAGDDQTTHARLKVPDSSTDPEGGKCGECFNDFGADIELDATWRYFELPFSALRQMEGWGNPRPASIDKNQLYGVQFQVSAPGSEFDLWIDDLVFTGCL